MENTTFEGTSSMIEIIRDTVKVGDMTSAKQICHKAISEAEDWKHFKLIGDAIADKSGIGDLDWARAVYKMAADKAVAINHWQHTSDALVEIAASIAERLNDKNWAIELYQLALDKTHWYQTFINIAESIANEANLGDKDWAREIYELAISRANFSKGLLQIGGSIANTLGDEAWTKAVYQSAIDAATELYDYCTVASWLADGESSSDKKWAREVYEEAINQAEDSEGFCSIAVSIFESLEDEEWTREVYKLAIDAAEDEEEMYDISESIADVLGDEEWAQELQDLESGEDYLQSFIGKEVALEKAERKGFLYSDTDWENPVLIKYLISFELDGIYDKYGFDNYSLWLFLKGEKIVEIQRNAHCMESFYEQDRFKWSLMEDEAYGEISSILK